MYAEIHIRDMYIYAHTAHASFWLLVCASSVSSLCCCCMRVHVYVLNGARVSVIVRYLFRLFCLYALLLRRLHALLSICRQMCRPRIVVVFSHVSTLHLLKHMHARICMRKHAHIYASCARHVRMYVYRLALRTLRRIRSYAVSHRARMYPFLLLRATVAAPHMYVYRCLLLH